jgi:RNA polymerase sigma-70 factor, ECF subfamily
MNHESVIEASGSSGLHTTRATAESAGRHSPAELYRTYGAAVYRRCLRLLRDEEEAHDATQDVFMKLVRDLPKLQARELVLPWIYRVATNACLNRRRNSQRRGMGGDAGDLAVSASAADVYPERMLAQRVLSRFDSSTQAIAVGVIVDGMEHAEVAHALGVSRRTVERKLQRFLADAREYVSTSEGFARAA